MSEGTYSVRDVAEIFGLQEARLRYWAQTGFVGPSVRRAGRFFYTFEDLIGVRVVKELLDRGLPLRRVRRHLDALRSALPHVDRPLSRLKVCSDGDQLVVVDRDVAFEPSSGQLVMAFTVSGLTAQLAEVTSIAAQPAATGVAHSAYQWFLAGCRAEDLGDVRAAETAYRRALATDAALAAAHTNLGNLRYRAGDHIGARDCYQRALDRDPEQPEARFNLGNVLDELGESELAVAELRQVCSRCPEFADAHFNLAVILVRLGGTAQARAHFLRYLELDPDSEWAERARSFLSSSS
jgi:tetratricopeptide (TPR) repeat protein